MDRTAVRVFLVLVGLRAAGPAAAEPARPPESAAAIGDSLSGDSTRIVRTLPPVLVRAARLDVLSSEARRIVGREVLQTLPLDRMADALALEPGVVVDGDLVSVRGARPGDLRVEIDGISMNEPFRGEGLELPVVALEELELIRGGREAEHGGGLAGTLIARPAFARDRWSSRVLWETDGGRTTHDDLLGARVSGPIPGTGLGIAIGGEAHLDDTHAPTLRTIQHTRLLGVPFAWRARNEVAALARLAPVAAPATFAVQAIVSRRLLRPWNPMFSKVGWTSPCPDDSCLQGPAYSPTEIDSARFSPYNAADHYPITDVQRLALIVSSQTVRGRDRLRLAAGWNRERRLTSIDGRDDESALAPSRALLFGLTENATSDPFHVYGGDAPYYRKSRAEWLEARADWHHDWKSGSALGAGLGATHENVRLRELDFAYVPSPFDSIRTFSATAPGASGWFSGRWVNEGLIANLGVRADWYSPGPDADRTLHDTAPHASLLFSPRLGLSFPVTTRDAFQVGYERLEQAPGREYLYDSRTARIVSQHPLGNPLLDPSIAISYEVLLRHRASEQWSTQAGFFYRDFAAQIGARHLVVHPPGAPASGIDVMRYESEDVGHALGLELTVERDEPGRSHLAATYTWMRTEGSESFEDGVPFYPLRLPQPPPIAEHPLAWDQPHRLTLQAFRFFRGFRAAWTTVVATGLPWTPAETRQAAADLSLTHSKRLPMFTLSDLSVKGRLPRRFAPMSLGLDVRNVFDFRGARRVSIDGWPNPIINTQFDDYAAHREQTGGGPAFWNDANGDGQPGWVPVSDPRLDFSPRLVRLVLELEW